MSIEIEYSSSLPRFIFASIQKKFFEKILKKSNNQFEISFGKARFKNYAVYTYYVPALKDSHKKYRKIETVNETYYESKECLEKTTAAKLKIKDQDIYLKLKYSEEVRLDEKSQDVQNLKILDNASRILRLSIPTEMYDIDISIRYIFENESKTVTEGKRKENLVKNLELDLTDFRALTIKTECSKILYDIEFELKKPVTEEVLKMENHDSEIFFQIQNQIIELLTGMNPTLEKLIHNYVRAPQVVSLTNDIMDRSKQEDFVSLLKTDGVRNLLVITILKTESRTFLKFYRWCSLDYQLLDAIDCEENKIPKDVLKDLTLNTEKLIGIFDCERVYVSKTQSKKSEIDLKPYEYYYVFDVYFAIVDCRSKTFEERMKLGEQLFEKFNISEMNSFKGMNSFKETNSFKDPLGKTIYYNETSLINVPLRIISKKFDTEITFEDIIERSKTILPNVQDELADIEFDGFILQAKSGYELSTKGKDIFFDLSKVYSFKVKPLRYNTIDFKLKNENSKILPKYPSEKNGLSEKIDPIYNLYLMGSGLESTFNLKKLARTKTTDRSTEILFLTPFIENTHQYNAELDDEIEMLVYDNTKRTKILKKVHPKDIDLNGKIIEMYFDIDKKIWKIHRFRNDKVFPNGYKIGLANMSLFFDPLRLESYYSPKLVTFPEELVNDFHDCSHVVREVIYKKMSEQIEAKRFERFPQINYLDIAAGRGGDLEYIFKLMKPMKDSVILNLFGTDISPTGLVKYALKTMKLSVMNQKTVNLNVIAEANGDSKQNDKLYNEIISRHEFEKFNVINMSFAIHYISNYLKEFVDFCKKTMANDCIFMLTFYDSEAVIDTIPKFKIFKDIKIDIKKNEAYMPLPTISSSGYREEPCMSKKHIEFLKKEFSNFCEVIEFNPFFGHKSKVPDNGLYFNCVKTLIFIKESL